MSSQEAPSKHYQNTIKKYSLTSYLYTCSLFIWVLHICHVHKEHLGWSSKYNTIVIFLQEKVLVAWFEPLRFRAFRPKLICPPIHIGFEGAYYETELKTLFQPITPKGVNKQLSIRGIKIHRIPNEISQWKQTTGKSQQPYTHMLQKTRKREEKMTGRKREREGKEVDRMSGR